MESASCHVKNPRKKRKMRHERVLRSIARNRVVHQGAEASDRVKRRRGGMRACKHVMQCHGGHELLRATVSERALSPEWRSLAGDDARYWDIVDTAARLSNEGSR